MMTVNKLIQFDEYTGNIPLPRLVLMTRSFEIIHTIPHFTNWRASIRGNELDEISFEVTKYVNGVLNPVWDDLIDLKIVSVECGKSVDNTGHECGKFEITVSYTDENKTTKTVTGVSLETELGQLMLHDFHVNDEFYYEGQEQEGLTEYIPTVLYIHNATEEQKKYSLLHRVLADKAPHWKISEQEDRVAKMAYVVPEDKGVPEASSDFNREYTVDGTSVHDFLTGDVAKDANIVFRFDTDKRELWFESLVDYVPEAGSSEPTVDGVGEDTTIIVSKAKLGNSINIESNKDNVKNCFRVEGGDDLMTSQVAVVNLTGTNYIYHFADFQLADMPETLQQAISGYNAELADPSTQDDYYGENGLYTQYTEANAQYYYLRDEMAPSIHVDPPATPYDQWLELKQKLEDPDMEIGVYMTNSYDSEHYVGITNNVAAMLEVWCDSRYTVEVLKNPAPSYDATNLIWTGYVRVTDYKDTTQHYPFDSEISSHPFTAKITQDSDDDLTYTRQKLEIALAKGDMYSVDEQVSDSMTDEEIIGYFSEWNLTKLQSFQTGYDTCKSVLMSGTVLKNGTTIERTIAEDLMAEYDRRLRCVATVIAIREAELKDQQDILDRLIGYSRTDSNGNTIYTKGKIQEFQENHSFYSYLVREYPSEADSLYSKFHAYIREDTYQNSNYTSESLETQKDLTDKAKELLEQADREIKKACVLQRTMTVSMNNLMAIPEFNPLRKKFEMFNYIRVRTEDEVLKLRLIGVDYSGDSMETVEVTFSDQIESVDGTISDLQSILNQAQSIATTYTAVSGQASKGSSAKDYILDTYRYGLDAANVMLKNSDDNEVTITSAGIIAKRMDDQGFYGDKQLRIIGNGMYMTEDAWNTVSMAVGEIQFANPITHQTSWKYGVIADAIVGKILVGQNLYIGNDSGSVEIDGNGIKITNGTITWGDGTNSVNSPTISDIPDLSTTLETITEEIEQLDGRIQTYCQPSTDDPSDDWTTTTEKDEHIGDIWYVTDEEVTKTYTKNGNVYSWQEIHDAVLETIASQRATIFTSIPNTALADGYCYKVNDLWYLDVAGDGTNNYPEYPADTVLVATQSATVYSKTHWVKKDRYTDDAALVTFIDGQYLTDMTNIGIELDKRAETWYLSESAMNTETATWNTTAIKDTHIGDIWYCIAINTGTTSYIVGHTYMYGKSGSTYSWNEVDGVPKTVFDTIDGKRSIFLSKPDTVRDDGYYYRQGDIWVLSSATTLNNVTYPAKTVLYATANNTTGFDPTQWSPATTKSAEDALTQISNLSDEYDDFKADVQGALTGNPSTSIGQDYIISPKIGGGYLYIANADTKRSVTIDPAQTYSSGGYIFKVTDKDGNTTIGADSNGNATFTGGITASSLTIQPNASISGMKIISSVAYAYANSDTNVQPQDSDFGPTMNPQKGKYLWTRTTTSYQGGSYPDDKVYTCAYVGNDGVTTVQYELHISTAAVVKSISGTYTPSTITLTAESSTGTESPQSYSGRFKIETTTNGSTWTTRYTSSSDEASKTYTVPADIKSIRCSLYSSGGTTTLLDQQSVPIVSDGDKGDKGDKGDTGDDGEDAYTVILTNESHTFAGTTTSAVASSTTIGVVGYKGATQVNTTVGTITGKPTGMSTSISNNGTKNTTITVSVTTSMVTANGTLTIPITVDGKTFNMIFSYAIAFTGTKGDKGDKGDKGSTGDTGVSVIAMRVMYAKSSSNQTAPTTGWSNIRPTLDSTYQYVWVREDIMFSNDLSTWVLGTPRYDSIITAECGVPLAVDVNSTGVKIHPIGNVNDYLHITSNSLNIATNNIVDASFSSNGIWIGGTQASPVFSVDTNGDGHFAGNIDAYSGSIGDFQIGSTFYRGLTSTKTSSNQTWEIGIISAGDPEADGDIYSKFVIGDSYKSEAGIYTDSSSPEQKYLKVGQYDYDTSVYNEICIEADGISGTDPVTIKTNLVVQGTLTADNISYVSRLTPDSTRRTAEGNNYLKYCAAILYNSSTGYSYSPSIPSVLGTYLDLGSSSYKWGNIYSINSVIQTSDRNYKNSIKTINNSYEDMFMNLEPVSFKMNDGKRIHLGFISQDVESAMSKSNLSDMDFAGFCKDAKINIEYDEDSNVTKEEPILDKDGNPEYIYSLRYSEFIALNTHMIQKLYKRVEELETELSELKKQK